MCTAMTCTPKEESSLEQETPWDSMGSMDREATGEEATGTSQHHGTCHYFPTIVVQALGAAHHQEYQAQRAKVH